MPRRRPRDRDQRREPKSVEEIRASLFGPSGEAVQGFQVNTVSKQEKRYICPYCSGTIEAGVKHVVAIPEGRVDDRRHYHSGCWSKFSASLRHRS